MWPPVASRPGAGAATITADRAQPLTLVRGGALFSALSILSGCFSPVFIRGQTLGVGAFIIHSRIDADGYRYIDTTGAGLMVSPGRASIGVSRLRLLTADPAHPGFSASLPIGDIAVGAEAERIARDFAPAPHVNHGDPR